MRRMSQDPGAPIIHALRGLARNIYLLITEGAPEQSAIYWEGFKANEDDLPQSACPYARQAQADEWQTKWSHGDAVKWI